MEVSSRASVSLSEEPLLILASEGTIIDLSPAAETLLESRRESLVGRKAQELVEFVDIPHTRRKLQAAENRRERQLKGAIRLKGRKAADAWVYVRVELPPASAPRREYVVSLKKLDTGLTR
jgi:PAS domain S-box-containing protein